MVAAAAPVSPPWSPADGITAALLGELLPLGRRLHPAVVRRQTQAVAQRLEDELGEERPSFIDTTSVTVRNYHARICRSWSGWMAATSTPASRFPHRRLVRGDRRQGHPADGRPACFGYVQTYDTKPKRRLFEVLKSQGMQANQQVTFLTDGGEDIRDLPLYPTPRLSTCWTAST